ncbi:MAG: gamma-glutamylcyclotransferase [Betaproteobacteria bacterium]|nr:gamma-glutamylcyclotransferase [Betaproteobacteria bacterium]
MLTATDSLRKTDTIAPVPAVPTAAAHVLVEAQPSVPQPAAAEPPLAHNVHAAVEQAYHGAPLCRDDLQHGSRRAHYLATTMAHIAWPEARLARSVDDTLAANPTGDVWVFGYGSLIWNPLLHFAEKRSAKIYGLHRSFCLWSRVNRGTLEAPGLVLGLDKGGACAGVVYRVERARAREELLLMWRREMSTGAYVPTWIKTRTPAGTVLSLAFVIDHTLPSYAGRLDPAVAAQTINTAAGLYGPCLDYFTNTAQGLVEHGIDDPEMSAVGAALATLRAG